MAATPIVGKDIDSWCTKCKLVLAHTIEAVVNGRVTRVHCNTCGGQHAYRAKAPGTSARKPRSTRSASERAESKRITDFATMLRNRDPSTAHAYATTERFKPGDLIRHPTFGLGLVTALKEMNKIEVVFGDGAKTLVHKR
jgi:hypothetical protein